MSRVIDVCCVSELVIEYMEVTETERGAKCNNVAIIMKLCVYKYMTINTIIEAAVHSVPVKFGQQIKLATFWYLL